MCFKRTIIGLAAEAGLTQRGLAEQLGISRMSLFRMLRRGNPRPATVSRLAAALGTSEQTIRGALRVEIDRRKAARWVRRAQAALGMTNAEFAASLGFSINAIERWRAGSRSPSPRALECIRSLCRQEGVDKNESLNG